MTGAQIDPLYPLALKLAGEPGVCAVFLGAGISRGAGVPTAWEIFLHSLGLLYRMKEGREPPAQGDLLAWRDQQGLSGLNYNSILEKLFTDEHARGKYLEGFFVGKKPSAAHRSLAALCKGGLIKVLVTTNFDQLMEQALRDVGLTPDLVSSPSDLNLVRRREISPCWLLKLHGDIGKLDIRNTPEELEALSQEFRAELTSIVQTYSLLIVGYAAWEATIVGILKQRTSKQSLFWMDITDQPTSRQSEALGDSAGHWIRSDNADLFFLDLEGALSRCTQHPHSSVKDQLQRAVELGVETGNWDKLRDLLQQDVLAFRTYWQEWLPKHNCDMALFEEALGEVARCLHKVLLAGLLVVSSAQAALPEVLTDALEAPLRERAESYARSGAQPILSIPRDVVGMFWHVLGAASVHHENYRILRSLLDLELVDPTNTRDRRCRLDDFIYEKAWDGLDRRILQTRDWHVQYVDRTPDLREHFGGREPFATALLRFDFLTIIFLLTVGEMARVPDAAWWSPKVLELNEQTDLIKPLGEVQLGSKKGIELAKHVFGMDTQDFLREYPGILKRIVAWCSQFRILTAEFQLQLPYNA